MLSRVLDAERTDYVVFSWPVKNDLRRHTQSAGCDVTPVTAISVRQGDPETGKEIRQAREMGFREGEAAAVRKAGAQEQEGLERLAAAVSEIAGLRREALGRAERDTVRLSVEIARRILHRELSVDTSALEALVRAALDKLRLQEIYRVRVHPGQEPILRKCLQERDRDSTIEVVGDAARARGEAVFETKLGTLDASVETQLREIERGLTDLLGERT